MTKAKATKETVTAALQNLEANGINTSVDNIRTQLGGGHKETISRIRDELLTERQELESKQEEEEQGALILRFPVPESMKAGIALAAEVLDNLHLQYAEALSAEREAMIQIQQDAIAAVKQQHKVQEEKLQKELSAVKISISSKDDEIDLLKALLADRDTELGNAHSQIADLNDEIAHQRAEKTQTTNLQAQLTELLRRFEPKADNKKG